MKDPRIKGLHFVLILSIIGSGYMLLSSLVTALSLPMMQQAYSDGGLSLYGGTFTLPDELVVGFEMILAARDAQIHESIMQREGGYQHKLIEGGKDFSGGERQRIEIARVLAQDPTIIILDEATSALDAKTEYEVVKAIKDRGIACIVVAHRLSTIRNCDEIIVMEKGKIVDRGTHSELMKTSALYQELFTSE